MRRAVPALLVVGLVLVTLLQSAAPSGAITKADHSAWPDITGALVLNRLNQSRPIDMRPGHDPFQRTDSTYSCDGVHKNNLCFVKAGACEARGNYCAEPPVMPDNSRKHHELLGGHGNDTIYAGDAGDVIWGDYNYPTNPVNQRDKLTGGPGPDFIYASHGYNEIHTGGGRDAVLARYGYGQIHCDSANTVVNLSQRSKKKYKLYGCKKITLKAVGTQQFPT
ncbi:MAG: calcium-binding protein [Solirubrobacterales bacterium]|nr:calcium-binding protein [Solirubrobacterales bacterium]